MKDEKFRINIIWVLRKLAIKYGVDMDYMYHAGDKSTWFHFFYKGNDYPCLIIWDVVESYDSFETYTMFSDIEHNLVDFIEKHKETKEKESEMNNYIRYDHAMTLSMAKYFHEGLAEGLKNPISPNELKCNLGAFIKDVRFNPPATIVFWKDGTKTVVKATGEDDYDPEKGLAIAISKKAMGNKHDYYNTFLKWLKKYKAKPETIELSVDVEPLLTVGKMSQAATEAFDSLSKAIKIAKVDIANRTEFETE